MSWSSEGILQQTPKRISRRNQYEPSNICLINLICINSENMSWCCNNGKWFVNGTASEKDMLCSVKSH